MTGVRAHPGGGKKKKSIFSCSAMCEKSLVEGGKKRRRKGRAGNLCSRGNKVWIGKGNLFSDKRNHVKILEP